MNARARKAAWRAAQKRVGHEGRDDWPTPAAVEALEDWLGFRAPPSYTEYLKAFGWGELCSMFFVWPPDLLPYRSEESTVGLQVASRLGRLSEDVLSQQMLDRLVPFGCTSNGDTLAWLRPRKQGKKPAEWPIVVVEHENSEAPVVASDLADFVSNFVLGRGMDVSFPVGGGQKWSLPDTFEPRKLPPVPKRKRASVEARVGKGIRRANSYAVSVRVTTVDWETHKKVAAEERRARRASLAPEKATKKKATKKKATQKKATKKKATKKKATKKKATKKKATKRSSGRGR